MIWLSRVAAGATQVRNNAAAIDVALVYPKAGGKAQESHCGVFRQNSDGALALLLNEAVCDALHGRIVTVRGVGSVTIATSGAGWTRSATPPAGMNVASPKNVSGWTQRPARDGLEGA